MFKVNISFTFLEPKQEEHFYFNKTLKNRF